MNAASVLFQLSSYELLLTLVTNSWSLKALKPNDPFIVISFRVALQGYKCWFYWGSQLARIKHLDLLDESTQSINMPPFVVKFLIVHYSCFKIFFFFFSLFCMTMRWQSREMVIFIMYFTILWNHVTLLRHKIWNFI